VGFNTDSGTVNCNFNDSDICGYADQSVGEIGWTRHKNLGKFANCILNAIFIHLSKLHVATVMWQFCDLLLITSEQFVIITTIILSLLETVCTV